MTIEQLPWSFRIHWNVWTIRILEMQYDIVAQMDFLTILSLQSIWICTRGYPAYKLTKRFLIINGAIWEICIKFLNGLVIWCKLPERCVFQKTLRFSSFTLKCFMILIHTGIHSAKKKKKKKRRGIIYSEDMRKSNFLHSKIYSIYQ